MNAAPLAIEAHGLTRRFGTLIAVNDVSLAIPRAQIFGFLGPNGSGKSTTIRMLCGLLNPSSGTIRALGLEIPRQAELLRARLGYMTQRFALWDDLRVIENLRFMANIYTLPRALAAERIAAAIAEYRLESFLDRAAATLSGGQKQRLALAAATLHHPELLLLDEPTSAVDPQSRRDFWDSLFRLTAGGTTILVSTHYMDEAERCHQLAILHLGRVVASGAPRELQEHCGLRVVEIEAQDVDGARQALQAGLPMRSLAQLGVRLHAMLASSEPQPVERIESLLAQRGITAQVREVTPGLEDVFVGATSQEERAA